MGKLSKKARMYARTYDQLPYGREIEGTAELLLQMADKLEKYEDTGTTPEQIRENDRLYAEKCKELAERQKKLEEYEDLEEQGKLLKLPCAVGDTVYHTCIPRNEELQIIEMKVVCVEPYGAIRNHKGVCEVWNVYAETGYTKEYFKFFDFGKTVFLAREEAETALKKLER